jgi:hypothetical protein
MIACVGRVLRLSLAVAFVSGLGFVSTSAQAFIDETLVCADPNSVVGNFDDSDNWADFSLVSNCNKICKSYVKKCKTAVKNNYSCINKAISGNAELDKKAFCDTLTDKSDKKECKQDNNDDEKAAKDANKADKEANIGLCEAIESDCTAECEAPVL